MVVQQCRSHLVALAPPGIKSTLLDLVHPAGRWENEEKERGFFVTLFCKGDISHPAHIPWVRIDLFVHLDAKSAGKCGFWLTAFQQHVYTVEAGSTPI